MLSESGKMQRDVNPTFSCNSEKLRHLNRDWMHISLMPEWVKKSPWFKGFGPALVYICSKYSTANDAFSFQLPICVQLEFCPKYSMQKGKCRSRGDAHAFFKERQGEGLLPKSECWTSLAAGGSVLRLWSSKGILYKGIPLHNSLTWRQ